DVFIFSSPIFSYIATMSTSIYTLSLHDALPILIAHHPQPRAVAERFSLRACEREADELHGAEAVLADLAAIELRGGLAGAVEARSEEHTSELQSRVDLVCRLLLEKKKHKNNRAC